MRMTRWRMDLEFFCELLSQTSAFCRASGKPKIVLFKSLRNCRRHKKGNFTLKSNSNDIMLCGATLSWFK